MFEKSYSFLEKLKQNNNREWFHANKHIYLPAREEIELVTQVLIQKTSDFDKDIRGLTPRDCIFRINRDVRFSTDKSPYKTNFGSFLVKGGRRSGNAGYYLHIEPGESLIAGGIYYPPYPVLRNIRRYIFENMEEFKEIVIDEELVHYYGSLSGEKLKTVPRGYPKDLPDGELLKFISYGFIKDKTDREMRSGDILNEVIDAFEMLTPLINFLNRAIGSNQETD